MWIWIVVAVVVGGIGGAIGAWRFIGGVDKATVEENGNLRQRIEALTDDLDRERMHRQVDWASSRFDREREDRLHEERRAAEARNAELEAELEAQRQANVSLAARLRNLEGTSDSRPE